MKSLAWAGLLLAGCASSRVPDLLDQTRALPPQAVTSADFSADGRFVSVTTLAFRHDPNFWLLDAGGSVRFGRAVAPWAPFQAAASNEGRAFGVGLAYSRVTSPYPMISLFGGEKDEETVLEDSYGDRGWLRYGEGDWRAGWLPSLLGDLIVRVDDAALTVRGHNGAVRVTSDGRREKFPLKYDRPFRMSPAAGRAAFGYIVPDAATSDAETRSMLRAPPPLVSMIDATTGAELWKFATSGETAVAPLPEPARDLPELAERFNLRPDALVPFRVAASLAPKADGSAVAVADYGGWLWVRRRPAIGGWNPPYRVVPFVPRQRGSLRIVSAPGVESARVAFPADGLFEVRADPAMTKVWAVPASWFARGLAGSAWLPTDGGRSVYAFDVATKTWTSWTFPDAVSDAALLGDDLWASCWDGRLHRAGRSESFDVGGPARLKGSPDGRSLVAGTENGEVLCLDAQGALKWRTKLPAAEPAPAEPAKPVFDGVPVYAVGRTGKEHAYVGDIWLVKTAAGGFLVDAGGTSSVPQTLRRIRAAGVEPKDLRQLLQTHSHGDHAGGAYLWRSMGLKIVAPESAAFALAWLMPMLTDYGVWVPRPVDVPLPLKRAGDEAEFTAGGLRIRAVFVPGHSVDSAVYLMELGGQRVAFTGDIGFKAPSDILHRCWGDVDKAAAVTEIVRTKVIPFRPDVVFTGHGGHAPGTAFLEDLVKRSEESILKAKEK